MKLMKYLLKKKISEADFARILDISDSYMYALTHGLRRPGKHLRIVIELKSEGFVKASDW